MKTDPLKVTALRPFHICMSTEWEDGSPECQPVTRTQPRWMLALIKRERPKHLLEQCFSNYVPGNPSGVSEGKQEKGRGERGKES